MSVLLAIGLNILIAAALYLLLNRKIEHRMSPTEMLDRIGREVEGIIRDLNQTTDRNIGLIEDRIESLKSILENVDKRIGLMKRESEKKEVSTALYNDILKPAQNSPPRSSGSLKAANAADAAGGGDTAASHEPRGAGVTGEVGGAPPTGPKEGSGEAVAAGESTRGKERLDE